MRPILRLGQAQKAAVPAMWIRVQMGQWMNASAQQ